MNLSKIGTYSYERVSEDFTKQYCGFVWFAALASGAVDIEFTIGSEYFRVYYPVSNGYVAPAVCAFVPANNRFRITKKSNVSSWHTGIKFVRLK